jgi:hypothetical protein
MARKYYDQVDDYNELLTKFEIAQNELSRARAGSEPRKQSSSDLSTSLKRVTLAHPSLRDDPEELAKAFFAQQIDKPDLPNLQRFVNTGDLTAWAGEPFPSVSHTKLIPIATQYVPLMASWSARGDTAELARAWNKLMHALKGNILGATPQSFVFSRNVTTLTPAYEATKVFTTTTDDATFGRINYTSTCAVTFAEDIEASSCLTRWAIVTVLEDHPLPSLDLWTSGQLVNQPGCTVLGTGQIGASFNIEPAYGNPVENLEGRFDGVVPTEGAVDVYFVADSIMTGPAIASFMFTATLQMLALQGTYYPFGLTPSVVHKTPYQVTPIDLTTQGIEPNPGPKGDGDLNFDPPVQATYVRHSPNGPIDPRTLPLIGGRVTSSTPTSQPTETYRGLTTTKEKRVCDSGSTGRVYPYTVDSPFIDDNFYSPLSMAEDSLIASIMAEEDDDPIFLIDDPQTKKRRFSNYVLNLIDSPVAAGKFMRKTCIGDDLVRNYYDIVSVEDSQCPKVPTPREAYAARQNKRRAQDVEKRRGSKEEPDADFPNMKNAIRAVTIEVEEKYRTKAAQLGISLRLPKFMKLAMSMLFENHKPNPFVQWCLDNVTEVETRSTALWAKVIDDNLPINLCTFTSFIQSLSDDSGFTEAEALAWNALMHAINGNWIPNSREEAEALELLEMVILSPLKTSNMVDPYSVLRRASASYGDIVLLYLNNFLNLQYKILQANGVVVDYIAPIPESAFTPTQYFATNLEVNNTEVTYYYCILCGTDAKGGVALTLNQEARDMYDGPASSNSLIPGRAYSLTMNGHMVPTNLMAMKYVPNAQYSMQQPFIKLELIYQMCSFAQNLIRDSPISGVIDRFAPHMYLESNFNTFIPSSLAWNGDFDNVPGSSNAGRVNPVFPFSNTDTGLICATFSYEGVPDNYTPVVVPNWVCNNTYGGAYLALFVCTVCPAPIVSAFFGLVCQNYANTAVLGEKNKAFMPNACKVILPGSRRICLILPPGSTGVNFSTANQAMPSIWNNVWCSGPLALGAGTLNFPQAANTPLNTYWYQNPAIGNGAAPVLANTAYPLASYLFSWLPTLLPNVIAKFMAAMYAFYPLPTGYADSIRETVAHLTVEYQQPNVTSTAGAFQFKDGNAAFVTSTPYGQAKSQVANWAPPVTTPTGYMVDDFNVHAMNAVTLQVALAPQEWQNSENVPIFSSKEYWMSLFGYARCQAVSFDVLCYYLGQSIADTNSYLTLGRDTFGNYSSAAYQVALSKNSYGVVGNVLNLEGPYQKIYAHIFGGLPPTPTNVRSVFNSLPTRAFNAPNNTTAPFTLDELSSGITTSIVGMVSGVNWFRGLHVIPPINDWKYPQPYHSESVRRALIGQAPVIQTFSATTDQKADYFMDTTQWSCTKTTFSQVQAQITYVAAYAGLMANYRNYQGTQPAYPADLTINSRIWLNRQSVIPVGSTDSIWSPPNSVGESLPYLASVQSMYPLFYWFATNVEFQAYWAYAVKRSMTPTSTYPALFNIATVGAPLIFMPGTSQVTIEGLSSENLDKLNLSTVPLTTNPDLLKTALMTAGTSEAQPGPKNSSLSSEAQSNTSGPVETLIPPTSQSVSSETTIPTN